MALKDTPEYLSNIILVIGGSQESTVNNFYGSVIVGNNIRTGRRLSSLLNSSREQAEASYINCQPT